MHQHLELIAKRTKPGRHAVVVMDGAGWHTNDIAADIPNLSILKLPPYSPELTPSNRYGVGCANIISPIAVLKDMRTEWMLAARHGTALSVVQNAW